MLVVYTATFAGFVIFLVQFIDTFTTVSLVHTHLMRCTLLISKFKEMTILIITG